MASYFVTSIAPGQWFYSTDASPDAVISAPRGSVAIRTDAGNVSLWLNVTAGGAPGTNWERVVSPDINGDLDLTGVDQITLADNAAVALDIGSTGKLNLLRFDTLNGAEQVEYNGVLPFQINTGGLTVTAGTVTLPEASLNVASASTDAANNVVTAGLFLRATHGAGASTTNIVLPARVGGWRIVDAYITSGGAAGGSVQVQTAGGAANITNAMVPGATSGAITRANLVEPANNTVASGATIRLNVAAGANAGEAFIRIEPL
jgi:hypothetical protein